MNGTSSSGPRSPVGRRPEEHPGGWGITGLVTAVVGILLVLFPAGGRGRPDGSGPSTVEAFSVLGAAGCGVVAALLGGLVVVGDAVRGWRLTVAIAAAVLGIVTCLMASVVAFSG